MALAQPALEPVKTSITVVENISADAPASVSVLNSEVLSETPGVNLDDRLRSVPGFSLFRRSSSLVAHPTTQGISLRGIGSSGASRTLVLWDGIPVNDPFGGWVYWTRFAPEEIDRVEVSRGASTSVFGDRALGGAIAMFSRQPEPRRITAAYEAGNHGTHSVSAGVSNVWNEFALSASSRGFMTGGYFTVPDEWRGSVDRRATVRFLSGDTHLDYFNSRDRFFLNLNLLAEERGNGTGLQRNSTGLGTLAGHYHREQQDDSFSLLAYHTRGEFRSAFSSIAPDRNLENLTFRQSVPSEAIGAAALWRHKDSWWNSLFGTDAQRVEGYSIDSPAAGGKRIGGGTQFQQGVFAQLDATARRAKFFLGGRQQFASGGHSFFSPSGGVTVNLGPFRARSSAYKAFRAPTLNELFREFRVGNAVTRANADLRPETLTGVETGLDWSGEFAQASFSLYRNSLRDLIANVTLENTSNQIIRQRRNAEEALSRGFEMNVRGRWRRWNGELGYLFADSRFSDGRRVPQIPRHQGSAQLSWHHGGTLASAGVRSYSNQLEDLPDRPLPGFTTVQLYLRQQVAPRLAAFAAFENLLDREYIVGLTPTPVTGQPLLWRAGLRWEGQIRQTNP